MRAHRAARRRAHRAASQTYAREHYLGLSDDFGCVAAWAAGDDVVDETRKRTHDTLVTLMGAARCGPVAWQHHAAGTTSCDAALASLFLGAPSQEHSDSYRRIQGLLREEGGYLVIAMAPGRK